MSLQPLSKSSTLIGAHDLTLIAPIKPGLIPAPDARSYTTRLKVLLRTLNAARISSREATKAPLIADVVDEIRAIRAFRLAIVGPEQNQLLLAVTFDGPWEAYLRQIWHDLGRLLDVIFCNCEGYLLSYDHSYADYAAWVRSAQVGTEYFYEASLLTVSDMHVLRERERALIDPRPLAPALTPAALAQAKAQLQSQAMPALVALFGLTDLYPPQPGNADGSVLWRAARLLLRDVVDKAGIATPAAARSPTEKAAWHWLFNYRGADPRQPAGPSTSPGAVPDQAQAGILAPLPNVTHACLVLLELADGAAAQALLATALPGLALAREGMPGAPTGQTGRLFHNLSFTFAGLKRCGLGDGQAAELPVAFREGMAARSGTLGDWDHNHPSRWALPRHRLAGHGGPDRVALSSVHAVLQLSVQGGPSDDWTDAGSAQARRQLDEEVARLEKAFARHDDAALQARRGPGVRVLAVEHLQRFAAPGAELATGHFDYADGISQPWTPLGGKATYSAPRDEVPLGDLLLGHPNGLEDDPASGVLWVNGSFLVVRKLRQHVHAWRQALQQAPGDEPAIRSQLMGRQPNGAGLVKPVAGTITNDFDYQDDLDGEKCPLHSHVRRAHPRTPARPELRRVPRIMRRGLSYGPKLAGDAQADDGVDRGLMFMAYNASIAEQFEVIQAWLAGGNSADANRTWSGLRDPFLGIPQPGDPRKVPYRDARGAVKGFRLPDEPLVTLQWGLYLFAPSADALRELQALARQRAEDEQGERDRRAAGPERKPERIPNEVRERADDARRRQWAREAAVGSALIARLKAAEGALGAAAAVDRWKAVLDDAGAAQSGLTQAVWTAVRQTQGGCLRSPYGVLVGSAALVDEVLQDPQGRYTVSGYASRMAQSFGRIYLGLDPGPAYQAESEPTNRLIMGMTHAQGFGRAWHHAANALAALIPPAAGGDPVSVQVRDLIDEVLAGISKDWFGLPDGFHIKAGGWRWQDNVDASCPGHFLAPSRYLFWPQPGPESEQLGQRHGQVLKQQVLAFVKAQRGRPSPACGTLGNAMLAAIPNDDLMARTLIGVMMGFLPTVDANLRLVLAEWLQDGRLWSLQADYLAAISDAERKARKAGKPVAQPPDAQRAAAMSTVAAELMRSLQRHPVPPLIWRTALTAHQLGNVAVNPGDRIAVGLGSAAAERLDRDQPDPYTVFGGRRTPTGAGASNTGPTHACPGRLVAHGVMLGVLAAVLDRTDLRSMGSATALGFEAGPLPAPAPAPAVRGGGGSRTSAGPAAGA